MQQLRMRDRLYTHAGVPLTNSHVLCPFIINNYYLLINYYVMNIYLYVYLCS
jgi:hypothetical protein